MSDSRFNLWWDFIIDQEGYDRLNTNAGAVVGISKPSETISDRRMIVEALRKNPQVVIMAVNQIEGDITFFHNIQELSGGIGSSFNSLVGLKGWGNEATAVQLEHRLFNHESTVICPSKDSFWTCASALEFKEVEPTEESGTEVYFKAIITLPPFLSKVLIDSSSTAPEELGLLAVSAGKSFLVDKEEASNHAQMKEKLGDVLCFLWSVYKNKIIPSAYALSSKKEITSWLKAIY